MQIHEHDKSEPAFPVNGPNGDHPGISYRQWLIGQVAPTMLNCYLRLVAGEKASIKQWANWPDGVAADAIAFADAIILSESARNQPPATPSGERVK